MSSNFHYARAIKIRDSSISMLLLENIRIHWEELKEMMVNGGKLLRGFNGL